MRCRPGERRAPDLEDLRAVDQVLTTTRSVRRRLDLERPVEPEVIEACIDIATQAPTGANREAWRFLVITEPEQKAAIADLYRRSLAVYATRASAAGDPSPRIRPSQRGFSERLHEFPALILACILGRAEPGSVAQQVALYGSILPAAWSLMLALRARGLGTTWTSVHLLHESEAARVLGIPDDVTQTVLLPVAYVRDAVLRPAERRPAREVTYWNAWGRERS
ncbi:MAG: nitroreductase family protein [Myxococcota bacterium]